MAFPKLVWDQLKNCTAGELIRALKADGWKEDITRGATRAFLNSVGHTKRRVVIHYHPQKTYGLGLLRKLIQDIGWSQDDLKRLRLIK